MPAGRPPTGYAGALGAALRSEFAERRHAAKILGRWTGAHERTIKTWLAGTACPNGDHLIALVAHSDAVLETVLAASRRTDLLQAFNALRRVTGRRASARMGGSHGPDDGPDDVTVGGTGRLGLSKELPTAARQRWFIRELSMGEDPDVRSLVRRFAVSARTAKRDVAAMKAAGIIRFLGTPRGGVYRLAGPAPADAGPLTGQG